MKKRLVSGGTNASTIPEENVNEISAEAVEKVTFEYVNENSIEIIINPKAEFKN